MVNTARKGTCFHTQPNIAGEVNVMTHCNNILLRDDLLSLVLKKLSFHASVRRSGLVEKDYVIWHQAQSLCSLHVLILFFGRFCSSTILMWKVKIP